MCSLSRLTCFLPSASALSWLFAAPESWRIRGRHILCRAAGCDEVVDLVYLHWVTVSTMLQQTYSFFFYNIMSVWCFHVAIMEGKCLSSASTEYLSNPNTNGKKHYSSLFDIFDTNIEWMTLKGCLMRWLCSSLQLLLTAFSSLVWFQSAHGLYRIWVWASISS